MARKKAVLKVKSKKQITVTESSCNIFADLGLPDANELPMKAELTRQLYNRIKSLELTQVEAGKRLGLEQPDVSKLMQGRFTSFSVDRLISLLNALYIDVEIVLRPMRNDGSCKRGRATVTVSKINNNTGATHHMTPEAN